MTSRQDELLTRLRAVLDARAGLYRQLSGAVAHNFKEYLAAGAQHDDEQTLTERVLSDLLEQVLGFPTDGYFPQLGKGGLKPDLTPTDLVAHRYVLDAKSSGQTLPPHEPQIRGYIDERRLAYGVLFNLHELRVYQRGRSGHEAGLSFRLLPLWEVAVGEAMASDDVERFLAFCELFAYRAVGLDEKVLAVREAPRWEELEAGAETLRVDVEYLVDRLRELSRGLAADAASREDALMASLALNPGREQSLVEEVRLLALDLEPGLDVEHLPDAVDAFRAGEGVAARAWRQYLLRVSQLALTRILLYRSWEDAGFVEQRLYDGGFGELYDRLDQRLQAVLEEAFLHGQQRYRWLYGPDNNYDWYRPGDEALIDILYSLVPVPLGKLDADVLGGLYESYVDEIDRDRLGQFYTPRSVVRFMLDRAGFAGPERVFDVRGDARRPRRLLDFATGSGGFVVEAGRRIIDEVVEGDARAVGEGLTAIVRGIHGCEISPFPYYLTEVNLLLQASRLIGRLRDLGSTPASFVLSVVHADTLSTRPAPDDSLAGLDPEQRADRGALMEDLRFGLVPLEAEKHHAFDRIRQDAAFDLVLGNPPYVAEAGNKVLFERLRELPAWRDTYKGKTDYLYYFLTLAAEKVAPDGRLCVITPAGWMNAGSADWLRERLAGSLRLDELFLFGSYRLFAPEAERRRESSAPTPTVESAILVATRAAAPANHQLRVVALEDEATAAVALSGDPSRRAPDRDALLKEMAGRAGGRAGRRDGIHVHRVRQADLVHSRPWPIKHSARDLPARVVRHLDGVLESHDEVEALGERWHIFRGIETAADAYSRRIQRRLPNEIRKRLEGQGAEIGDPILELPPGREKEQPWVAHPELLAHSLEPRAILYGALDANDYTSLVWIGREDDVPEEIAAALQPWREVLATRAEFARNPRRRWYETAWPRDKEELRGPKVISLHRTGRGRFVLDEDGTWQPSLKTTLCAPEEAGLSVAYLCGLLNSELLDLWYDARGTRPRDVWRDYEPAPMARIPYRHTALDEAARVAQLRTALTEDQPEALDLGLAIADDLAASEDHAAEAAAALAEFVRAIAANRRALLPHRVAAPELTRIVKDPWRTDAVTIDPSPLVAGLSPAQTISARLDPELTVEGSPDGRLGRPTLDEGGLT